MLTSRSSPALYGAGLNSSLAGDYRGLCDRKKHRDYAVNHFNDIQHPVLKRIWGSMLFDADAASPEIVQILRNALRSPEQANLLSGMIGPKFADFKRRVMTYSDRKP